jgi:hypothetical protein
MNKTKFRNTLKDDYIQAISRNALPIATVIATFLHDYPLVLLGLVYLAIIAICSYIRSK